MRPKKTILCVDADPERLLLRGFLLETRGFAVLRASSVRAAADMLTLLGPGTIEVLVVEIGRHLADGEAYELVAHAKGIDPWLRTMTVSAWREPIGFLVNAEVNLHAPLPVDLVERVRTLAARKRGPKKKPVAGVRAVAAAVYAEGAA